MAVTQHLRLALNQVSEGVVILDAGSLAHPGPGIIYASVPAQEMVGRPLGELQGCALSALCESREAYEEFASQAVAALQNGRPWEAWMGAMRSDGSVVPAQWKLQAVSGPDGAAMNFLLTLTSRRKANVVATGDGAEVGRLPIPAPEEYQADSLETIRETARRVAHEFNNALTRIQMPVEMAMLMARDGTDLHEKLNMAIAEARKAAGLAKDFLDCFRPRLPQKERCNLRELLGRVLRLSMVQEHVEWELNIEGKLSDAEADPEQIDRLIFNLVRNACDAMQHKGRLLVLAQDIFIEPNTVTNLAGGLYVMITVRDFGPGIPEEHLRHIFHARFTTKPHGNGCGLPICRQIVRQHGGEIFVSSKVPVGTAFAIFLPALSPVSAVAGQNEVISPSAPPRDCFSEPAPHSGPKMPKTPNAPVPLPPVGGQNGPAAPAHILLVEDDPVIRSLTSQIIGGLGYGVEVAAAGEEALCLIHSRQRENRPFDSVIMDINLRGARSGIDTCIEIRRMDPGLKVIATSGEVRSEDELRGYGFVSFLAKPYSTDTIRRALEDTLSA